METGKLTLYDKLKNHSAVILNGIFTFFAVMYALLQGLGWELVPFSYGMVWIILTAFIAIFFCLALNSKEYTSRAKTISCNLMPITGGLFGMWVVSFFEDQAGMGALLAVFAMIASMTIGFGQGEKEGLGTLGKVVGGFLAVVILASLGFTSLFSGFAVTNTIEEEFSPDGTYLAEAYSADQGALGGDTVVTVRREIRKLPTPLGWISDVDEATVYAGEWGEADVMTISWKDDDTLMIMGRETEMSEYFD